MNCEGAGYTGLEEIKIRGRDVFEYQGKNKRQQVPSCEQSAT
jgi:hypothetical protein